MKKSIINLIFVSIAAFLLASCGSSKKASNEDAALFTQPCYEYSISNDTVLRAWAVGISDSETTARKKANATASADLASMLQKIVKSTIENYCVTLSEGEVAESRSFLNEKTTIVVNQTLKNVYIVCDKWLPKDEATGMFKNFIALELNGSEFLKKLGEELNKNNGTQINKKLLDSLFLKSINEAANP